MVTNEHDQPDNRQGDFSLPEGYFKKSAESILNKIEWEEEHKEFAGLQALKRESGFITPEKYFESSDHKLELLHAPTLALIQKNNSFGIPENYFENTEITLLADNLAETENDLQGFEMLSSIPKLISFQANNHYFSGSEKRITELAKHEQEAKQRSLFSVKLWYAVAAMLVITLGLWMFSSYNTPVEPGDCGTIACLDKTDLIQTKTLENLENEELYELVNSKELEEHLNPATGKTQELKPDTDSKEDLIHDLPEGI